MVQRDFKPLISRSFFLFGPRGVGKSTWLRDNFSASNSLYFNLLDRDIYENFLLQPQRLGEIISLKENLNKIIILDEIQKVPALLDIIHDELSRKKRVFILTGSSARKLKQKGINLLAGRASFYQMYPLSISELGEDFNLTKGLERGLLPEAYFSDSDEAYKEFLKSYVFTYIEKEIQQEQWVRKLEPFRKFLQIAAQMNTKIINKSKIANQIGVESSTIESYFEILEDTLLGFRIPGFETSIRKQVRLADKFYFVDTGIVRAIEKTLSIPMIDHTSYYGSLFENFIVMEIKKIIEYRRLDWSLFYLCTKENLEIDLIIRTPQNKLKLIEIKSSKSIGDDDLKSLITLGADLDKKHKVTSQKILISQDPQSRLIQGISCLFYKEALKVLSDEIH
ncbi:MAG TPA: AAA family ATPase [Pseudobdellovibrionaceae bacterium]|nr:AAA family ATPase [Pseudobdellovibrionaceae bacterium]